MPDRETIVRSIQIHCRAISAHNKAAWLQIWADDAEIEDPVGVSTYRGIEAVSTGLWAEIEAIKPINLWLEKDIIVCGDEAIAILAAEVGSGQARRLVGPIVDHFFTFNEDGKIAKMRAFWKYDEAYSQRQAGAIKAFFRPCN